MVSAAAVDVGRIVFYVALVGAAIMLLGAAIWLARRRLLDEAGTSGGSVLTLQQLRELRGAGEITEDEFQLLRRQMLGGHGLSDGSPDD